MLVKVQYFKPRSNGYGGAAYTYRTAMDLSPGDKVVCPTVNDPEQRGIVVAVNVPEPDSGEEWVKRIRSITKREE